MEAGIGDLFLSHRVGIEKWQLRSEEIYLVVLTRSLELISPAMKDIKVMTPSLQTLFLKSNYSLIRREQKEAPETLQITCQFASVALCQRSQCHTEKPSRLEETKVTH